MSSLISGTTKVAVSGLGLMACLTLTAGFMTGHLMATVNPDLGTVNLIFLQQATKSGLQASAK
ncbi:MAG: hypothetical protein U9R69_02470 [Thermodesulfobacteriota bacterium]|nr:hypothetical protein [Thermodesulfobacteriota bacterium]